MMPRSRNTDTVRLRAAQCGAAWKAIAILCLTLTIPTPGAQCAERPEEKKLAQWERRQFKLDRREAVSTVKPSTGIATGLVIAYGHPIALPYKFEYREQILFVNGVQLIPSPFSTREQARLRGNIKSDKKRQYDESEKITAVAGKMYREGKSQSEIIEYLVSNTDVIAEAKWVGPRSIDVRLQGESRFTTGMEFSDKRAPQARPAAPANEGAWKSERIHHFENKLRRGHQIFFQSDNAVVTISASKKEIVEIMARNGITAEEKAEALAVVLGGNSIAAFDIIANFAKAEWEPAP